jgi:primary-amine oxidase
MPEYIWNYHFYQDGSIEFEIRLTGILSVYVAKDDELTPFSVKVAPNLNAQYHQHMFSIRIDPMIDGLMNSVVETDVVSLPNAPTASSANYAGNAFVVQDTVIKTEGGRAYDYNKERRWRIVNPGRNHYSSGNAVGYTLGVKGGATPMMARPDSWAAKRATFLKNSVWVCRDIEAENSGTLRMWPAGKYVPQTKEAPEDSVGSWVEGKMNVEDEDILVYLTIGKNHIPPYNFWT